MCNCKSNSCSCKIQTEDVIQNISTLPNLNIGKETTLDKILTKIDNEISFLRSSCIPKNIYLPGQIYNNNQITTSEESTYVSLINNNNFSQQKNTWFKITEETSSFGGWIPVYLYVVFNNRVLMKLEKYIDGEGDIPTEYIGQYVKESGTYTSNPDEAFDFTNTSIIIPNISKPINNEIGISTVVTALGGVPETRTFNFKFSNLKDDTSSQEQKRLFDLEDASAISNANTFTFDDSTHTEKHELTNLVSELGVIGPFEEQSVAGKTIYEFVIQDVNTISDLRTLQGNENQLIRLLGYYEAGDKNPVIYKWISGFAVDDGGSVISVSSGYWKALFEKSVNIKDFGVVLDNPVSDSSEFLSKLTVYLNTNKLELIVGDYNSIFYSSSTFFIPPGINIDWRSKLSITGAANIPIIGCEIGVQSIINSGVNIKGVDITRVTLSNWEGFRTDRGLIIHNLYSSNISVKNISRFSDGFIAKAYATGFVYNNIEILNILNCRNSIILENENNGWVNENSWYAQRIWNSSSTHQSKSRTGILIDSIDELYYNNNNVFYKPSLELASRNTHECRVIDVKYGQYNQFLEIRNEGNNSGTNGSRVYFSDNLSFSNKLNEGYGTIQEITRRTNSENGYLGIFGNSLRNDLNTINNKNIIYRSGFLGNKISQYSATQLRSTGPLLFGISTNTTKNKVSTNMSITKEGLVMQGTRGIMVTLNTQLTKNFIVTRIFAETSTLKGNRIVIRAYDSNGDILNNITKNHIRGGLAKVLTYYANPFSGWRSGSDTDLNIFSCSDETVKVDVIIQGDPNAILDSFNIYSIDGDAEVLEQDSDVLLANSRPTNMANEGTLYYNNNTELSAFGWIYINNNWIEIPKLSKSSAVSDASSENITIQNTSTATDISTLVADFNELVLKYNSVVDVLNSVRMQFNIKLAVDKASGQQES